MNKEIVVKILTAAVDVIDIAIEIINLSDDKNKLA